MLFINQRVTNVVNIITVLLYLGVFNLWSTVRHVDTMSSARSHNYEWGRGTEEQYSLNTNSWERSYFQREKKNNNNKHQSRADECAPFVRLTLVEGSAVSVFDRLWCSRPWTPLINFSFEKETGSRFDCSTQGINNYGFEVGKPRCVMTRSVFY